MREVGNENIALRERVERLEQELGALKKKGNRSSGRRLRWVLLGVLIVSLMGVVAIGAPGTKLECEEPGELFCFNSNTPAKSSEINHNFAQLKAWMEQKLGSVGTNDIAVPGNANVTGSVTSGSVSTGSIGASSLSSSGAITASSLTTTGGVSASSLVLPFTSEGWCRWTCPSCLSCRHDGSPCLCHANEYLRGFRATDGYIDLYCCRFY